MEVTARFRHFIFKELPVMLEEDHITPVTIGLWTLAIVVFPILPILAIATGGLQDETPGQ